MKDFFIYFFGQGETVEFEHFSLAHFLPIIIMIGVIALIIIYRDKLRSFKHEKALRLAMAFIMIICEMSYYWRLTNVASLNPTPVDHLPITLCGWAMIFCSYLVVTKNQTLFDLAYFWVLAGSIFALVTPTVITYCGPTRFRYYQFWIEHTFGFISIFYMIFVHGMRPNIKSIFKSMGGLIILAVIAIVVNGMIPGANYLYVAGPETTKSILDFLPKNYAVRLTLMFFIVCAMFFLCYLPWMIKDIKTRKAKAGILPQTEPNIIQEDNDTASTKETLVK